MSENRTCFGVGGVTKGHEESFGNDWNIFYLDYGDYLTDISMFQD